MVWSQPTRAKDFASVSRPSLAEFGQDLYMTWRGPTSDQGIYYSFYNPANPEPNSWRDKVRIQDVVSRASPSLAEFQGQLYWGWRRIGNESGTSGQEDQNIYYAVSDGNAWTLQPIYIQDHASYHGPSLAKHAGRLYMAWRGPADPHDPQDPKKNDQNIYFSVFYNIPETNTWAWSAPVHIPGRSSWRAPSIAEYAGQLYMAWRGYWGGNNDQGIWYSVFNDNINTWEGQKLIEGRSSLVGPSLAEYAGRLYMAWRGYGGGNNNDQNIYYSSFDGNAWTRQETFQDRASSEGPSLAKYRDQLYMAWRGPSADEGIWYSFLQ
jgi:hypothetical protein